MKDNLLLLLALVAGVFVGLNGWAPAILLQQQLPAIILGILIFQVGLGLGSMDDLKQLLQQFHWQMLLLPLFTIVGTLLFSLLAVVFIHPQHINDLLAVGSGFGYYSLSSVLINQLKSAVYGKVLASQLAAVALLTNVIRELLALFGCKYITHKGGSYAAISVAGINSMDVCLPSIMNAAGSKSILPVAVFHGLVLEISVPMLISFFCS